MEFLINKLKIDFFIIRFYLIIHIIYNNMDKSENTVIYSNCPECDDPKTAGCSCPLQQSLPPVGIKVEKTPTSTTCSGTRNTNCPSKPSTCSGCYEDNTLSPCSLKNTQNNCGFWFCSKLCDDNHFHTKSTDHKQ